MTYLLTYKFSQDHIELFFSAVRGRGGFNNTPTAIQFKAAYKRLLMRHKIKCGTGNCSVLDNTTILNVETKSQSTVSVERKYDLLVREQPIQNEHDYADIPNFETMSEFKTTAINYIAGAVVKMVQRRLKCMVCNKALTTCDDEKIHQLIKLKDRGALVEASPRVICVCLESEKCFQRLSGGKLPQGFGISASISAAVLFNCADMNLFAELNEHQFETIVTGNHVHNLVKIIAQIY